MKNKYINYSVLSYEDETDMYYPGTADVTVNPNVKDTRRNSDNRPYSKSNITDENISGRYDTYTDFNTMKRYGKKDGIRKFRRERIPYTRFN